MKGNERRGIKRTYFLHIYIYSFSHSVIYTNLPSLFLLPSSTFPHASFLPSFLCPRLPPSPPLCLYTPLPPSSALLSQSLLFMKVNLQVYQELLAGGGLRCSNHNKASPSTWNRNGIVGILGYFHHHTLHMMIHSHLPLSTNEHPCSLPASPFGSCLALSYS